MLPLRQLLAASAAWFSLFMPVFDSAATPRMPPCRQMMRADIFAIILIASFSPLFRRLIDAATPYAFHYFTPFLLHGFAAFFACCFRFAFFHVTPLYFL